MEARHSGLGIASFVTSLVVGLLLAISVVIAGIVEATTPGGMDEESPAAMLIGCSIILLVLAALVALGLGVAGMFQANRNKVFAILGMVFSGLAALATIVLIIVGLAMS